jgi:hypothetical protein
MNIKMTNQKFEINRTLVISFVAPITILCLGLIGFMDIPYLFGLLSIDSLTNYKLFSLIFLNFIFIWLLFTTCRSAIVESTIIFNSKFIEKKKLGIGSTKIYWNEITNVHIIGSRLILESEKKRLEINLNYFKHPKKTVEFIQEMVDVNSV